MSLKEEYEKFGGNWDDVKNVVPKYPLLMETIRKSEREKCEEYLPKKVVSGETIKKIREVARKQARKECEKEIEKLAMQLIEAEERIDRIKKQVEGLLERLQDAEGVENQNYHIAICDVEEGFKKIMEAK